MQTTIANKVFDKSRLEEEVIKIKVNFLKNLNFYFILLVDDGFRFIWLILASHIASKDNFGQNENCEDLKNMKSKVNGNLLKVFEP